MQKVTENVFVETGFRGCNCGFVSTRDGVVMIDSPERPTDALTWKDEVERKGVIKYLINTEHHLDHILGTFFFPGILIAHEGTKERGRAAFENMEQIFARVKERDPDGFHLVNNYVPKEPEITFDNRLTLYLGDHVFELINLPGHTPNETIIHIPKEKVVFTGDNVVYRVRPVFRECCPKRWVESLEIIKGMDVEAIIPGHGEVRDKGAIDEMVSYIEDVFDQVRVAIGKGLTKEETVDQVKFDDRMPLEEHQKASWPERRRTGVFRIYEELTS